MESCKETWEDEGLKGLHGVFSSTTERKHRGLNEQVTVSKQKLDSIFQEYNRRRNPRLELR